jgi:hypothetical protein
VVHTLVTTIPGFQQDNLRACFLVDYNVVCFDSCCGCHLGLSLSDRKLTLADEVILMIYHKTEIPGQVGIGCLDVIDSSGEVQP